MKKRYVFCLLLFLLCLRIFLVFGCFFDLDFGIVVNDRFNGFPDFLDDILLLRGFLFDGAFHVDLPELRADEGHMVAQEEEQDLHVDESFLEAPLHDTGSNLYLVLSFFLPILGLIAGAIFKKHNYIRNFKKCRTGAIAGLIVIGVLIVIFLLGLLLAVI